MSRECAGATAVWRAISTMRLACTVAGIVLGAAGYGIAARASDRAGQVLLGVLVVVLCAVSVAIPSFDAPGLFLES